MQIHPSKLPFIAGPFGGLNYGSQCQLPAMRVNFEVALDLSHGGEVSKNVDENCQPVGHGKTHEKHMKNMETYRKTQENQEKLGEHVEK